MRNGAAPARWSPPTAFVVALAALVVVGAVAHWCAGYLHDNLPLTPFYLVPIVFCSWFCERRWAFLLAVLATVILFFATREFSPSSLSEATMVTLQFVTYNLVAALVTHLRTSTDRERTLARMDSLTGLSNTRAFTEIANAEIHRMHRFGKPLSAAYLDLDNLKRVNDENGHEGGDGALRLVGEALQHCVRSIDTAARLGGDEFALLMPETDRDGARVVVRRLQQRVTELSGGKLTCSMGCATFTTPPRNVDDLLKVADDAMYSAKRSGRDRVVFADGGQPSGADAPVPPRTWQELRR